MDREGLEELFAPFGPVNVRRVFSGHGVYAERLCFALALRGEIFIKTDAETEADAGEGKSKSSQVWIDGSQSSGNAERC